MQLKRKIRKIFRKSGYEILKLGNIDLLEPLIYYHYHRDFFFIQIGANNGKRYDPIFNIAHELNLSGLVIEPIKTYFYELKKNYSSLNKIIPVNKAIYNKNLSLKMYRHIEDKEAPDWVNGIASVDSEHYKKSGISKDKLIEEWVEAITFDKLIEDYKISHIDLLQIDTEGYDYNLLTMFPFNKFNPKIIHFEHQVYNDVMTKEQFLEICALLINYKYKIIMKEYDCIAHK